MRRSFLLMVMCLFLAGGASLMAFRLLSADLFLLQTERFLSDWQARQQWPGAEAWRYGLYSINKTVEYSPFDSHLAYDKKALIYYWQPPELREANSQIQNALDAYRVETLLYPDWPYAWLHLIQAKAMLHQFDDELYGAMERARVTGGSQLQTHFRVASLAVRYWGFIDKKARISAVDSVVVTSSFKAVQKQILWNQIKRSRLEFSICNKIAVPFSAEHGICSHRTDLESLKTGGGPVNGPRV